MRHLRTNDIDDSKDRGSVTVEAAFVIPIVTLVCVMIVLLICALYDRVKLEADSDAFIRRCEELRMCGQTPDHDTSIAIAEEVMSGYLLAHPVLREVETKDGRYEMEVMLVFGTYTRALKETGVPVFGRMIFRREASRPDRAGMIRSLRKAKDLVDRE